MLLQVFWAVKLHRVNSEDPKHQGVHKVHVACIESRSELTPTAALASAWPSRPLRGFRRLRAIWNPAVGQGISGFDADKVRHFRDLLILFSYETRTS